MISETQRSKMSYKFSLTTFAVLKGNYVTSNVHKGIGILPIYYVGAKTYPPFRDTIVKA